MGTAAIDRNILRMGTYELLNELDTPVSVIIDEAVEIAKSFSEVRYLYQKNQGVAVARNRAAVLRSITLK